jgi:hypothetical protein
MSHLIEEYMQFALLAKIVFGATYNTIEMGYENTANVRFLRNES